ncbi:hypothetical protein [Streptomyces lanatus]|uniref:Integral membrane protein n=1 Tax=Streptomyces lanatus TaxID=66900 RepID=A0ABV1XWE6_9ACTN|nr:hypothetical protein [Streptomyces lanatus]GHH16288.1 hypothetical protein GCM10018780_58590 [Streptomyces lanatus]
MLALRLTRGGRPAVQLRRLLVAAGSAGTGFLLLSALGYAMSHPDSPAASSLRLAWCVPPLAATIHLAVAVARTDPGTKPRPGLAAIGLGPARLMLVSATTTALSCTLGSMLALLVFLHLRGDLTGMPFDGAAAQFLAADSPLPLPAALTLLALTPGVASGVVAVTLRPKGIGTSGPYGRFGVRSSQARPAGGRAAVAAPVPQRGGTPQARAAEPIPAPAETDGTPSTPGHTTDGMPDPLTPRPAPRALPWGITLLTAGLAVETYASRAGAAHTTLTLPSALPTGPAGVLLGWILTALGLALAAPGLVHLCGRLLQSVRPGPLRLLAGRGLMAEATRIGRPLGVVCAVASAAYAMAPLSADRASATVGPLSTLAAIVITGCTVATLVISAVEARQARADTTAALLRLGAPTSMLRRAAALRVGALLAVFGPLTLIVAELAALPLAN